MKINLDNSYTNYSVEIGDTKEVGGSSFQGGFELAISIREKDSIEKSYVYLDTPKQLKLLQIITQNLINEKYYYTKNLESKEQES